MRTHWAGEGKCVGAWCAAMLCVCVRYSMAGPPVDGGHPGGRRAGGHPGGRWTGEHGGGNAFFVRRGPQRRGRGVGSTQAKPGTCVDATPLCVEHKEGELYLPKPKKIGRGSSLCLWCQNVQCSAVIKCSSNMKDAGEKGLTRRALELAPVSN